MKPTWLIEKDVFTEGEVSKRIMKVIRDLGMEARPYRYIGFGGGVEPKDLPQQEACIIAYGSINAAKFIGKRCKWIPGVWCDFNALRCRTYLSYWGKYSIQREYLFLPLFEVARQKEWLYKILGNDGQIFIRPDDNAKSFHGEIVAYEHFERWFEVANIYEPGPECLTMVSRIFEKIDAEWRFIVADKQVITGSQYRLDGKLDIQEGYDPKAFELAQEIVQGNGGTPHPIFCIDICRSNGKYYLMEIGSVNCCGLYALDLEKFVVKASEIAEREWQELMIDDREEFQTDP